MGKETEVSIALRRLTEEVLAETAGNVRQKVTRAGKAERPRGIGKVDKRRVNDLEIKPGF